MNLRMIVNGQPADVTVNKKNALHSALPPALEQVAAMRAIVDAFEPLADFEQSRVLRWAAERYCVTLPAGGERP